MRSNRLSAPTHRLGKALNSKLRCIEGFLAPSAANPAVCNLVIFPDHVAIDQLARSITTRPCKRLRRAGQRHPARQLHFRPLRGVRSYVLRGKDLPTAHFLDRLAWGYF